MKKVISLILIAAMLLGALPVLASAQTNVFAGYDISLGESIAVEFYAKATDLADFDKLIFYKNDTQVAEITNCPVAESDGMAYFKCDKLGPHEMDASIKAELYLTTSDDPVDTKSVRVLDYCTAALTWNNEKLTKLIVDMLHYGVAAQAYTNSGTGISEYIDNLDESVTALGASGNATVNALSTTVYEKVENPTVSFTQAALVLNSGIVPSFTFTTVEDVSNLTAVVSCAGKTWEINSFKAEETANTYTFNFYGMNPSQVRSWIFVAIKDAQGNPVSHTCAFTAEHYAAKAAESEQALTSAMMHYGDAVKAYVTRDITESVLTDDEKAALSALTVAQYDAANVTNQKIVTWAYGEAGIDVSASFDKSVFNLMKAIFEGDGNTTTGRTPIQPGSSGYVAKYSKMLVDGYYGGTEVNTDHGTFVKEDFQVGDVFMGWIYPDSNSETKKYYAGIYLGDGKFLMSDNVSGSWSAAIDTELVFSSTLNTYMATYCVLSPKQLAQQETAAGLTDAQKAIISELTPEQYKTAAKDAAVKASGIVNWAYGEAGIDVSDSFDQTVFNLMKKIFEGDGSTTTGRTPIPSDSDSYVAKYSKMLVDGYYGGTEVKTTDDKLFTAADFQVGDVFCAMYYPNTGSTSRSYYAGIYLGNGKFLMSGNTTGSSSATIDTELVFKTTLANDMAIYFVLRPAQYFNTPANG